MRHPRSAAGRSPAQILAHARWLLMGLFALQGITAASWLARLPAVRDALGISPSALGAVLLAGALGALVTVSVAGVVVTRFGGRTAMTVAAAAVAVSFVLLGAGPALGSVPLVTAGVFFSGVGASLGSVPINVESAAVERRIGRSVLPQFHAAFSVGAVLGALAGALAAHLEVPVLTQFLVTAVLGTAWRLASIPRVILDTLPASRARALTLAPAARGAGLGAALGAYREPRTLLIGLVVMAAAVSEGAANNWLSLAVVDGFTQPESVGAVFFGLFLAAMTVVRLLGTRLLDRYDRIVVLRVSGLVSLGGLVLFGFAPTLALAGVGVVAWGLGAALAMPIGIGAASRDPLLAAGRVAVISAFAAVASLAAPPLLGIAAESIGTRRALVLITVAMVVSVSLARHVGPPEVPESTRPGDSREPDTWGRPVAQDWTPTRSARDASVGAGSVQASVDGAAHAAEETFAAEPIAAGVR